MIVLVERLKKILYKLKIIIFTLSCLGVFGGAVNYGAFGIIPAIPYFLIAMYISVKNDRKYLICLQPWL